MVNIIVKNSCIKVEGYEPHSCPALEKAFMVFEPTLHSFRYVGLHYNSETQTLYLPRGIDIHWLQRLLNTEIIVERNMYNKFDYYGDEIKVKYLPRDDDQIEALQFAVGRGRYTRNDAKSQLCINLNTGKGKTYVSIGSMSILGIKSAVITYSRSVLLQWKKCIMEYTNITSREIYEISGSQAIYNLLVKDPEKIRKIKVFLVTHGTLKSYGDTKGWDMVTKLFEHLKIGIKFFDEAHTNFENMCMVDFYTNVYKTYYLTATPGRSNTAEDIIYQFSFMSVESIDLFHPDSDPHTHYIAMRYNSRPSPEIISWCKNKYGLDRNKYTNYIVTNENFQKMAIIVFNFIFCKILKRPEDQMIVYIGTNEAILKVMELLKLSFPALANDVGIFSSLVDSKYKQEALDKKIILTTTKSAGAAIDIRNLKCTLVLAEPFKSAILAQQTLGRTRNGKTYYIELVDRGFRYCNKYYLDKKKVFLTYAIDTKFMEFSDVMVDEEYNKVIQRSPVIKYGLLPFPPNSLKKPVVFLPKPITFSKEIAEQFDAETLYNQ